MDSSQGVLGGAICNTFDMAYFHKVSGSIAMIGCKDGVTGSPEVSDTLA